MNRVSVKFRMWNGFALKGQHRRRIFGNLYFTLLLLIFFMFFTGGIANDFGLTEGYQLLVLENVLGLIALSVMLAMLEMSISERQGLALNLAQSDLEQFHSSFGFGIIGVSVLLIAIQVLTVCVNGLLFDVWKSWQECLVFVMRWLSIYLICFSPIYAKDFRVRNMGNGILIGIMMILGLVGNNFLKVQFPFLVWGIILLISLAFSYGLGRMWHCRHEKG